MKYIKWRSMIITCVVCLLPILLGVAVWDELPQQIAVHFDMNNMPDNFASKGFAVFGMPILMMFLQIFCCIINDINAKKHGERKKFELATKWIIPVMTIFLQIITLGYSLGWNLDIRKCAAVIVSGVLIVIGNYLPKLDYIKNYDINSDKARKINRFIGFESVVMGILFLISIFLPPIATVICVFLIIPYTIIAVIYSVKIIRE